MTKRTGHTFSSGLKSQMALLHKSNTIRGYDLTSLALVNYGLTACKTASQMHDMYNMTLNTLYIFA